MGRTSRKSNGSKNFFKKHSLGLAAVGVVILLIALYARSDPSTHLGSFFGNAIADWTGVTVTVIATKYLYERGSRESKQPKGKLPSGLEEFLREHSLTLFLLMTGGVWIALFLHMSPDSRWGQVVGNIVSEWTQILGLVLLSKHLIEVGSKENSA
jgi:hypothetical protein